MPKHEQQGAPMPAETIAIPIIASKKLVEGIVIDLYDLAKSAAGFQLKKWKAANHAETISKHIRQLRMVRTILQTEREIDLAKFYCPSRILIGKKRSVVNQLADFQVDCSLVVEGTVGQGKSIFLRYLAAVEFCTTRRIPVFIQLQRCRSGLTIVDMALSELKALGFEMTPEVFYFFVGQGRILLLLDAFDEVKEELRADILAEIENLIRQYEALRVIVTSRPQCGISNSPLLRVFKLCPLEDNEYEQVIQRMAHDEATAKAIISGIRKEAARVVDLLTTPLMVALLMIRYKIDQSLPQNNVAFYESLFSLLLQRHDKSKGGYTRPRKSGVGDTALEEFFNALCFVTSKANQTSFKKAELIIFAKEAHKIVGQKGDFDKILADIMEITCLLISDGDECRFIHKNIQEYHAALFIQGQPEDTAIAFYAAMEKKWQNWKEELGFLKQIDRYRYLKFFYIKEAHKLLTAKDGSLLRDSVTSELMSNLCGEDRIGYSEDKSTVRSLYVGSTSKSLPTTELMHGSGYIHEMFEIGRISSQGLPLEKVDDGYAIRVNHLLTSETHKKHADAVCSKFCKALQKELQEAEAYVAHVEGMKTVFQF
jgi:hypothetical protein